MRLLEISPVWWHFIFYIKHPILYFKVVFVNNLFPSWRFSDLWFQSALLLRAWDCKYATNAGSKWKICWENWSQIKIWTKAWKRLCVCGGMCIHSALHVCFLFQRARFFLNENFPFLSPSKFQWFPLSPPKNPVAAHKVIAPSFTGCLMRIMTEEKKGRILIPASCRLGLQIGGCPSPGTSPDKQVPDPRMASGMNTQFLCWSAGPAGSRSFGNQGTNLKGQFLTPWREGGPKHGSNGLGGEVQTSNFFFS